MKVIALLLFILGSAACYGQNIMKVRAGFMSITTKNDYGNWDEWSEPTECNVLIVFDTDKLKLNIYSSEPQEYDVIDSEMEESTDEVTYTFNCIDKVGEKCYVTITKYNDPVDTGKITIMYPRIAWVYMIYWI